ncbi:hypothetical protein PENSPDRAFT_731971 [Peniophora sp. CONT]|nr:hypothetical protein PENSPDRAFT_731971 [Peniophora sp. CONT]
MVSSSDIRTASLKTIAIFKKKGLACCLVGSGATSLWGVPRVPNDIDLVVMTVTHTQEDLKRILASEDPNFSLVPSSNPRNTYKVVWYTVPGSYTRVKVDVLLPGVMNIPTITKERFVWFSNNTLPSMPLLPLLLLKLQAWDDHRTASLRRMDLREKQHVDVADINVLLPIAKKAGVHRSEGNHLPSSFLDAADRRVRSYVVAYPTSKAHWKALGFVVESATISTSSYLLGSTYSSGVTRRTRRSAYSLRF